MRHGISSKKDKEKQRNRPISVSGLCRFFNHQFQQAGYGAITPLTKETKVKINGFIKVLKNNGYSDQNIYELIEKYIAAFEKIKSEDMYTANNKKYVLAGRPSLRDLIICRDCIINKVYDEPVEQAETGDTDWSNVDISSALRNLSNE